MTKKKDKDKALAKDEAQKKKRLDLATSGGIAAEISRLGENAAATFGGISRKKKK